MYPYMYPLIYTLSYVPSHFVTISDDLLPSDMHPSLVLKNPLKHVLTSKIPHIHIPYFFTGQPNLQKMVYLTTTIQT